MMFRAEDYNELKKLFFSFMLPSVGSQLLSGVYTIVDGFFIGMGTGEAGLAAVGLAFPFTVFVTAVGAGIGVGGGALISISAGRGRVKLSERVLASMLWLMVCASLVTSVCFSLASGPLLALYDVSPRVAELARVYALILLACSPAQVFTMGMLGAVRNDGFPQKAMYIMVGGFLLNILFDWLWVIVWPFGIQGAAWATVLSQAFTAVLLSAHFFAKRSRTALKIKLARPSAICGKIISMGISPFGVQTAAAVTMILHNWQALAYGGDLGVAAYAVVGYVVPVGVMLQEGIADGVQPLVSFYYGANLTARRRITQRLGFSAAFVVGAICSFLVWFTDELVPVFFSMEGEAASLMTRGLLLSVAMYPFLGIAKVGASYFQAVGMTGRASLLTYGDPFVLVPLFLWTLPPLLGLDGVWLAMPCANVALAVIFGIMWRRETGHRLPLSAITSWPGMLR